jgi:hypothetical protein
MRNKVIDIRSGTTVSENLPLSENCLLLVPLREFHES